MGVICEKSHPKNTKRKLFFYEKEKGYNLNGIVSNDQQFKDGNVLYSNNKFKANSKIIKLEDFNFYIQTSETNDYFINSKFENLKVFSNLKNLYLKWEEILLFTRPQTKNSYRNLNMNPNFQINITSEKRLSGLHHYGIAGHSHTVNNNNLYTYNNNGNVNNNNISENNLNLNNNNNTNNSSNNNMNETPKLFGRGSEIKEYSARNQDYSTLVQKFQISFFFNKYRYIKYLSKGPPNNIRWIIWMALALCQSGQDFLSEEEYLYLINKQDLKFQNFEEEQIKKDLYRSNPNSQVNFFNDKKAIDSLYNILKAFALDDPELGYCQGMNILAATILLISDGNEFETFNLLRFLFKYLELREFFLNGFPKLIMYIFILKEFIKDNMPKLYDKIVQLDIPEETWIFKWLQTLYNIILPTSLTIRLLDCILCFGLEFLLNYSLALLKIFESKILLSEDINEFLDSCKIEHLINPAVFEMVMNSGINHNQNNNNNSYEEITTNNNTSNIPKNSHNAKIIEKEKEKIEVEVTYQNIVNTNSPYHKTLNKFESPTKPKNLDNSCFVFASSWNEKSQKKMRKKSQVSNSNLNVLNNNNNEDKTSQKELSIFNSHKYKINTKDQLIAFREKLITNAKKIDLKNAIKQLIKTYTKENLNANNKFNSHESSTGDDLNNEKSNGEINKLNINDNGEPIENIKIPFPIAFINRENEKDSSNGNMNETRDSQAQQLHQESSISNNHCRSHVKNIVEESNKIIHIKNPNRSSNNEDSNNEINNEPIYNNPSLDRIIEENDDKFNIKISDLNFVNKNTLSDKYNFKSNNNQIYFLKKNCPSCLNGEDSNKSSNCLDCNKNIISSGKSKKNSDNVISFGNNRKFRPESDVKISEFQCEDKFNKAFDCNPFKIELKGENSNEKDSVYHKDSNSNSKDKNKKAKNDRSKIDANKEHKNKQAKFKELDLNNMKDPKGKNAYNLYSCKNLLFSSSSNQLLQNTFATNTLKDFQVNNHDEECNSNERFINQNEVNDKNQIKNEESLDNNSRKDRNNQQIQNLRNFFSVNLNKKNGVCIGNKTYDVSNEKCDCHRRYSLGYDKHSSRTLTLEQISIINNIKHKLEMITKIDFFEEEENDDNDLFKVDEDFNLELEHENRSKINRNINDSATNLRKKSELFNPENFRINENTQNAPLEFNLNLNKNTNNINSKSHTNLFNKTKTLQKQEKEMLLDKDYIDDINSLYNYNSEKDNEFVEEKNIRLNDSMFSNINSENKQNKFTNKKKFPSESKVERCPNKASEPVQMKSPDDNLVKNLNQNKLINNSLSSSNIKIKKTKNEENAGTNNKNLDIFHNNFNMLINKPKSKNFLHIKGSSNKKIMHINQQNIRNLIVSENINLKDLDHQNNAINNMNLKNIKNNSDVKVLNKNQNILQPDNLEEINKIKNSNHNENKEENNSKHSPGIIYSNNIILQKLENTHRNQSNSIFSNKPTESAINNNNLTSNITLNDEIDNKDVANNINKNIIPENDEYITNPIICDEYTTIDKKNLNTRNIKEMGITNTIYRKGYT